MEAFGHLLLLASHFLYDQLVIFILVFELFDLFELCFELRYRVNDWQISEHFELVWLLTF